MAEPLTKEWFELQDIRERNFSQDEWIPVYVNLTEKEGEYGTIGYTEEYKLFSSALIFNGKREKYLSQFRNRNIGELYASTEENRLRDAVNAVAFVATNDSYRQADIYYAADNEMLGVKLVMIPAKVPDHLGQLIIHQDFILAYGLKESDHNTWFIPDYYASSGSQQVSGEDVVKIKKDVNGRINCVMIKSLYLKDYLAARNAALRLGYYIARNAVFEQPLTYWPRKDNPQLFYENKEGKFVCEVRNLNSNSYEGDIHRLEWVERAENTRLLRGS